MTLKKLGLGGLLAMMLVVVGCGDSASDNTENNADTTEAESAALPAPGTLDANDPQVIKVGVTTMQCEMCVKTVTDACEGVEGVEAVDVRLGDKAAFVKVANVSPEKQAEISKAIAKSGYTTEFDERAEEGYAKLPDCCKSGEEATDEHVGA